MQAYMEVEAGVLHVKDNLGYKVRLCFLKVLILYMKSMGNNDSNFLH